MQNKPSDGLAFVRNNFALSELITPKAQLENLTQENEQLKSKVTLLEKAKSEFESKVQNLENLQKQSKRDLNKREGIIGTLHAQLENLTQENELLKSDVSENENFLMAQSENLTQENENLRSKRLRYRRRIRDLLNDLDGYQTLIRASEYFLDSFYYGDDEDLENNFRAFESLFRRL